MTPHATPAIAQQLRSLAASAPTLHRPALAAAADAVEELSKLRAERDEALTEWRRECVDADNILFASGLQEPQWRTDGGSLQVPRIVAHFKALRAERDEARELLQRARECEGLDFWTDDDASSLREDIDAALKDAK